MKYRKYLFDLDGVLVDTLNIQYDSRIKAISKYVNLFSLYKYNISCIQLDTVSSA